MKNKRSIEVELRARITLSLYRKLALKSKRSSEEDDIYYRYAGDEEKSWIVRIRNSDGRCYLTFKSNKAFGEGAWDEVDLRITNNAAQMMHQFLQSNSFQEEARIIKRRHKLRLGDMEINIDKVKNLGYFIEVEVLTFPDQVQSAKQKIEGYLHTLGVSQERIVTSGYVRLMREKNG